jgi:general secretion pathway protein K
VKPGRREQGYALIAAVVSIVVFALMALTILNATRGTVVMASAELDRARLSAAADAGIALAIQGLMEKDPAQRWKIDGRPRLVDFDENALTITVEDEHGKIALNLINEDQVETMFAAFGLQGIELEEAANSFMDWRDEDDDPRLRGAEFEAYAALKIRPRNGPLHSVGELAMIRSIGPTLATRMAPYVTVNFGTSGAFDPRYASAIAIRVSGQDEADASRSDFGARLRQGGVIDAASEPLSDSLVGRPLTIRVNAARGPAAQAHRAMIVELTGAELRPYVVRGRE